MPNNSESGGNIQSIESGKPGAENNSQPNSEGQSGEATGQWLPPWKKAAEGYESIEKEGNPFNGSARGQSDNTTPDSQPKTPAQPETPKSQTS